MTRIQEIVVSSKIKDGYIIIGFATGASGRIQVLSKGKHTVAINCLGYDEHVNGLTYKIEEGEK